MPGGLMCKIDLEDAYFAVTLTKKTQKYLISMDGSTEQSFVVYVSVCVQLHSLLKR